MTQEVLNNNTAQAQEPDTYAGVAYAKFNPEDVVSPYEIPERQDPRIIDALEEKLVRSQQFRRQVLGALTNRLAPDAQRTNGDGKIYPGKNARRQVHHPLQRPESARGLIQLEVQDLLAPEPDFSSLRWEPVDPSQRTYVAANDKGQYQMTVALLDEESESSLEEAPMLLVDQSDTPIDDAIEVDAYTTSDGERIEVRVDNSDILNLMTEKEAHFIMNDPAFRVASASVQDSDEFDEDPTDNIDRAPHEEKD